MVGREFRVRYLGSLLGGMWTILNPLAMIFIYTVIFSKIMGARLGGGDEPMAYGRFICAGLLTWGFFAELLGRCPHIFIEHANMLKKVNFPRITLPFIVLISSVINFSIIFGLFILFLLVSGQFPGWSILTFIPLLLIQQTFVLGLGIFLATMNVFFRDVGQLLGIVLQFWFWLTPIVYPLTILPERVRRIIELNPMTQFVTAYQKIILYGTPPDWARFVFHMVGAIAALCIGYIFFQRLSDEMVDEL